MKTAIEKLEDVTAIATSPGNANANAYMLGMANGLILAQSIMKDEEVEYLKAPEKWLSDLPTPAEPTVAARPEQCSEWANACEQDEGA